MLTTKIPFYFIFVAGLAGGLVPYATLRHTLRHKHTISAKANTPLTNEVPAVPGAALASNENGMLILPAASGDQLKYSRQKGYEFMKPMLLAKKTVESVEYAPLKAKIENLIAEDKQAGLLTTATVYLMRFDEGKWMYVNPQLAMHPGSLIKVPMLITYLKEAEADPKVLDRKIVFENNANIPRQTYTSSAIQSGRSYTVKELLRYMIVYSDNNATSLLNENVNLTTFYRTFTELNLPQPNVRDRNYEITARRISKFFIVLYNATYLSRSSSEYALKLLNESEFKDGMLSGMPANISVAHKFGEWGDKGMNIHELHETGIVYLNNSPYIVTIMTRGTNPKDLSVEIGKISKTIYDVFSRSPDL